MTATTTAPWAVDPARINHRAVRLVEVFKDALARMRDEDGLTLDDLKTVLGLMERFHDASGVPLIMFAQPLFGEVFLDADDGYAIGDDIDNVKIPGAPLIHNPGTLPMRTGEPGTPLIASGRVLDGHGRPLAGAELEIYHVSNDGRYSGFTDGLPKYNLRARQITDAEGRYAFTTIKPVPYPVELPGEIPSEVADDLAYALAALGRSRYRPAHIHYEVHHPDLIKPFIGEVYFAGDPVIPVDATGPNIAPPSMRAELVRHDDPADIAAHGFEGPYYTAVFDFILKTRISPEVAGR